jgi:hypothetical protein
VNTNFPPTVALMGANSDRFPESAPVQDDDPDGSKLLSAPDPIERAAKLLNPLSTPATKDVDVWVAIYDVAVRRSASTYFLQVSCFYSNPKRNIFRP